MYDPNTHVRCSSYAGSNYQYGTDDRGPEFLCVVSREYPTSNNNANGHDLSNSRTDKAKVSIS